MGKVSVKVAGGVAVALCLLASAASPASAWVQGMGEQFYWAPGPPPGPELSLCQVETGLHKDWEGDYASIIGNPNAGPGVKPSACQQVMVTVVTAKGGRFCPDQTAVSSMALGDRYGNWPVYASVSGPKGCAIVGGNFWESNGWGYIQSWSTTAF
jgi:hypothetical protein